MSPVQLATVSAILVLSLFLTVGHVLLWVDLPLGMWLSEVLIFLGITALAITRAGGDPLRYPGLLPFGWGPAAFGFAAGTLNFFAAVVPIQFAAQWLAPDWLEQMFDSTKLFEGKGPFQLAVIIGAVALAAPLCEEYFFRGVLQRGLLPPTLPTGAALLVTSIVFSAAHLDPVGFAARVELGLLFGVLALRAGSLWPAVTAHAANNVVSTLVHFASKDAMTAPPQLLPVALVGALGALALGALWRWGRRAALLT